MLIETREASRVYQMGTNQVTALDRVSMGADEGEFVAIQGTSGSGKSTLLNLIGGLDQPTSGDVVFDAQPLGPFTKKQIARYRRFSVGMIFQNFNLIPTMTADENVRLALAFGGMRGNERRNRASELLDRVGLSGRAEHRPAEMSGGEQQRVAIARALMNRPSLILADEPTGNLDAKTSESILDLLWQMRAETGATLVMVTHNEHVAKRGERVLEIAGGRIR